MGLSSTETLMTTGAAATSLGVTSITVRWAVRRGLLDGRRVSYGRQTRVLVTSSSVERYRRENLGQHGPIGRGGRA